jgi:hypothetical protein
MRVSIKDLNSLVLAINEQTGANPKPYENGQSNIGTYCISQAYGGVQLHRIMNTGGGVRVISPDGYGTKKQLYTFLQGFLQGLSK